jgi:hypothetical protein
MSREFHVRFWEGVGVKLPHATRLFPDFPSCLLWDNLATKRGSFPGLNPEREAAKTVFGMRWPTLLPNLESYPGWYKGLPRSGQFLDSAWHLEL